MANRRAAARTVFGGLVLLLIGSCGEAIGVAQSGANTQIADYSVASGHLEESGTLAANAGSELGDSAMSDARALIVADKHDIEMLQRLYAKATDTIGRASTDDVEEGRAIYHRIFADDVQIRTANTGGDPLVANSPDAWVDVVHGALKNYTGTQHLIGSQIVDVDGDAGAMESYVNAWHKNADGSVYYFLGTYISTVQRTDAGGWKIVDMTLRHDSSGTVQMEG